MNAVAGRYEIGRLLGSGGSASVYRAHDDVMLRDVAIKIIPFGEDGGAYFDRFRHEALALSRLKSRHIARVHDFGRDDAVGYFLVMELIEGVPLTPRDLGRALFPHEVLRVARGLLGALAEAHAAGIVHRDIKPANVLAPGGLAGLLDVRLLDFGIARSLRRAQVQEGIGLGDTREGVVLGTPAYMAPEQLVAGTATAASDVYAAGLVLFELVGQGPLFAGDTLQEQVGARLRDEPVLDGRLDAPLLPLLARMLARDPAARFADAAEALAAIEDLDTAPVSIEELARVSGVTPAAPSVAPKPPSILVPSGAGSSVPAFPVTRQNDERPSRAASPALYGHRRLTRLATDGATALVDTLRGLDLAMLDALARRDRGSEVGRVARALVLALRLELDAAALLLEPLCGESALARAVAEAVVAPRARRATRARIEPAAGAGEGSGEDRDAWVDAPSVPPELAAMLVSLTSSIMAQEDAERVEERCRRAAARLGAAPARPESTAAATLRMALVTAAAVAGRISSTDATAEFVRLRDEDAEGAAAAPFHALVRALLLGALTFRADEHLAREQLELASRLASESGVTLIEVRATVAWGGMLVEVPGRLELGLRVLERATTLLAHGDAPALEHIAEHNRGAALLIEGQFRAAAPHLRRARAAASGELPFDHEVLSCDNELFALLALGDEEGATRAVKDIADERLTSVSERCAAYAHVARALYALVYRGAGDARAEIERALERAAEDDASCGDARVFAEVIALILDGARGEEHDVLARAGEIEKRSQDRGLPAFYGFAILRGVFAKVPDEGMRGKLLAVLDRLALLLGPVAEIRT